MRFLTSAILSPFTATLAIGAAMALLSGCPAAGTTLPGDLLPVTGTIQLNDQPLALAAVSFIPEDTKKGVGAFGATDTAGKYTLKWHGANSGDGVSPGKYRVVVSRMTQKDGSPVPADKSAADVGAEESLPPRYSDINVTELTADVTPMSLTHDFKLVAKTKK